MQSNEEQSAGNARRSDKDAHAYVMSLPVQDVVRELVDLLGAPLVAVIGGVNETRAVQQWITGRAPQRESELRFALQIATMIAGETDTEAAKAWFHGSNPHLGDRVPALIIRDEDLPEFYHGLMEAARAFARRPSRDASQS